MKSTIFIFLISFCLNLCHGNDKYKINEGASTSSQQDIVLDECTRCEIQNYAFHFVHLMFADDNHVVDIMGLVTDRFYDLEIFHEGVTAYTVNAAGPPTFSPQVRDARLQYFYSMVDLYVLEIFQKACKEHYTHRFYYEYNQQKNTISVYDRVGFKTGTCLCLDYCRRRDMFATVAYLPLPKKPEKKSTYVLYRNDLSVEEVTGYHVIPLPLITRFFRLWLMDTEMLQLQENFYNECTAMLLARLRRSMQKILLHGLKKSPLYSSQWTPTNDDLSFSNEAILLHNLERSDSWLAGNMFIGPVERGPFVPSYQRHGDELLEAFEYHSAPIIGIRRYEAMLKLFHRLLDYVRRVPTMNIIERLSSGFFLFSNMIYILYQGRTARFNPEQWEKHVANSGFLPSSTLDPSGEEKRYWIIRNRRDPRSADYYNYKTTPMYNPITLTEVKIRWRRFVTTALRISLEASNRNQTLLWSCNMTNLYDEYLNQPPLVSKPNNKCPGCTSFDEFLYLKASNNSKWDACNFKSESTAQKTKWCAAWRRILKDIKAVANETSVLEIFPWKSVSQEDVGTVISWLVAPEKLNQVEIEPLYYLPREPFNSQKESISSVDVGLCLFSTLIPTILNFKSSNCRHSLG